MRFEHLVEINDPLNPLIEPLSTERVWHGLMYRVDDPTVFLPGLESCSILSRAEGRVERELHFGQASVRDVVTFEPFEWVRFESSATADHAGGRLTIRLEQPETDHLFLRFTYETTLSEAEGGSEGVKVSEFVKAAYRESDLDTVRVIRLIATTGYPH